MLLLQAAISQSVADYIDLRAVIGWNTKIEAQNKKIHFVSSIPILGIYIRLLLNGTWAYTSVEDPEDIFKAIKKVEKLAFIIGKGQSGIVSSPAVNAILPWPVVRRRPDNVSLEEKIALVQAFSRECRDDCTELQSTIFYADTVQTQIFVNSDGSVIVEPKIQVVGEVEVSLDDGSHIHRAVESFGGKSDYCDVESRVDTVSLATRRAESLAKAESVSSGTYDVICDQELTGVLVHEVVGHLLEADVVASNMEHLLRLRIGAQLASEKTTIVDDPSTKGEGYYMYDDEGIRGQRTCLIQSGRIQSYLHTRETAHHFKVNATGHGRAVNYAHKPLARMSNTFLVSGHDPVESLFEDITHGIYARGARGAVGGRFFTLEPQEAFIIESGKVLSQVNGVCLYGDAYTTLQNIDLVANDFVLHSGGRGGCFKEGQGPLRVASGGPHIRIRNIQI